MPVSLKVWLSTHSANQITLLAKFSKTSVPVLRHIANGYRNGSAEAAIRISAASAKIINAERIDYDSICPAFKKCPYYQRAKADGLL
jgi:hypothetical protein